MNAPASPLLRCHSGKFRLHDRTAAHLPAHQGYVEPFGTAGADLLWLNRLAADQLAQPGTFYRRHMSKGMHRIRAPPP
jgi:hypothetical protein